MFDTLTIILVFLTLSAVGAAGFSVLFLSRVKKNLSELGMRVLESQDIGKIKEAANKTDTFESRLTGFEQKADESKNQLAEQRTKLNELADRLGASEQKMESFEVRFNELSTKLGSVEQTANKNENGLSQTVPNIKALADEIKNLKMFQSATEKARNLIIDAFNDMQAGEPSDEGSVIQPENPVMEVEETTLEDPTPEEATLEIQTPEDSKTEDTLKDHEEWQIEDEPQRLTGSRPWQS